MFLSKDPIERQARPAQEKSALRRLVRREADGLYIPAHILACEDLSLREKALLGEIAQYPNGCYASKQHLAWRLGVSERQVFRMLRKLEQAGRIIRSRGSEEHGGVSILTLAGPDNPVWGAAEAAPEPVRATEAALTEERRGPEPSSQPDEKPAEAAPDLFEAPKPSPEPAVSRAAAECGQKLAETRRRVLKANRLDGRVVEYYSKLCQQILDAGEFGERQLHGVVAYLATPAGEREWEFGLANLAKGYQHAFVRNFGSLLTKARRAADGDRPRQTERWRRDEPEDLTPYYRNLLEEEDEEVSRV